MILPALSIRQPWARAIVEGVKDVENRSWPCPEKYIGQSVFVHASGAPVKSKDAWSVLSHVVGAKMRRRLYSPDAMEEGHVHYRGFTLHRRGIVGIVTITGCVRNSASPWAEEGQYHWTLADALCLEFHPCHGRLGFFQAQYPL